MSIFITGAIILVIAISMSMVGKGGGNFYVITLVLSGVAMHQAASTSQAIMFGTSLAAMLIFSKSKIIDWKLVLLINTPTAIMAFVGGYFAGNIEAQTLKIVFSAILIMVSFVMLFKVKDRPLTLNHGIGFWTRTFNDQQYTVNLWLILPLTSLVGLFAGAVGISGGAFLIPIMVLLCGVPMRFAVGTSSAMVTFTSLMGLLGHSLNGTFDLNFALPLVGVAIIGGIIGGKLALKSKPKNLKIVFALTNLFAGIIMLVNIIV